MTYEIEAFSVVITSEMIEDLRYRLEQTRWPDQEPVSAWSQGLPLGKAQDLVAYWLKNYDMNRLQDTLNAHPQFTTSIFGLRIHFLHIKSRRRDAIPLLLIHGWPGSVLEFRHVIEPLTNPEEGAELAFDLVIPSLPGYGFSEAAKEPGWGLSRTAEAFAVLMQRLNYCDTGYYVQGGDWGADIAAEMGHRALNGVRGVHMNTAFYDAKEEIAHTKLKDKPVSSAALKALSLQLRWERSEDGYFKQQATRPQTLGYGLADSPAGQLAWLYEKYTIWAAHSELDKNSASVLPINECLDQVMLYWFTNTATSSARLYWEAQADSTALEIPEHIAVGVSLFPADQTSASRDWGERYYKRLVQWNEVEAGGHFGAWEQPEIFVREVRMFALKARNVEV